MPISIEAVHTDCVTSIDKEISFRPVTMEEDLLRLHQWMNEPHVVPFWKLGIPLTQYQEHLNRFLSMPHQQLLIGCLDGVPMSYWETYWVKGDLLSNYYPFHSKDRGVHLLIGPPLYLNKGYALPLLKSITEWLFQNKETKRVVAEPDIRNKRMIHIFKKAGYLMQQEIDLPEKRAALLFCQRDKFEALQE